MNIDSKEQIITAFEAFEKELNGSSESQLHQVRKQAFVNFKSQEFPTTRHEEWKYTNVKRVVDAEYAIGAAGTLSKDVVDTYIFEGLEADVLVFLNGRFQSELSTIESQNGILVANLKDAYASHAAEIDAHFGKYAQTDENPFTALNTSFAQDGAFVKVAKGKAIERPVLLLFFADANTQNAMAQPRNLIVAEENAQVSVVERFITLGEQASFTNIVTEVSVAKEAIVNHYKIQADSSNSSHIGTTEVHQAEKSHFANTTITMGGGLVRNNLNISLNGEHSEGFMNGLYMLTDKSHVDNHTMVDHKVPNCYSNELYKGILDGNSTGVFNGKIFVRQDAQKTNAFQQNNNIVLSDKATIDTKPQLEIWADDVKCSHGATVGALDEEPMFYLRSRGIPEDKARSLLMFAFAADLLDRIKIEPVRKHVEKLIADRLDYQL